MCEGASDLNGEAKPPEINPTPAGERKRERPGHRSGEGKRRKGQKKQSIRSQPIAGQDKITAKAHSGVVGVMKKTGGTFNGIETSSV